MHSIRAHRSGMVLAPSGFMERPVHDREPLAEDITSPVVYLDMERLDTVLRRLRRERPVVWVDREPYRAFWAVLRHADVTEVERQHELFISSARLTLIPKDIEDSANTTAGGARQTLRVLKALAALSQRPMGDLLEWFQARRAHRHAGRNERVRTLIDMDEPEHRRFRDLTQSWFMGAGVRRLEATIEATAQRYVTQMREGGPELDFAREVAMQYPLTIIMTMLGLPEQDAPFVLRATQQLLNASDPDLGRSEGYGVQTVTELFEYYVDVVRHRRRRPGEDLVSVIANARIDGKPLGPVETLSYLLIVTIAGHETTSASISGGFKAFIDHPAERLRFRPEPEAARIMADEVVRWVTPIRHFCRTATRDCEVGGVRIARGESLALLYPSANRDESEFTAPYEFRIDRKPNRHLGFGHGVHHCLGRVLALTEIRAFFSMLLPQLREVEYAGPALSIESNLTGGLKSLPVRVRFH